MTKRKMKGILGLLVSVALCTSLVACGSKTESKPKAGDKSATTEAKKEVKGLDKAIAEQPILLTSVGQSADLEMVKALMDNAALKYNLNKVVKANEIKDEKTLVLAVGGSSKGLGAAGIKVEDELKRTEELIKAAKDKKMTIIAVHVGGENRRGELSDKFIKPSLENANYIIVVESGNKDGLFTNIASEKNIPMDSVKSIADVMNPLKKAFK
ncbi:DUF6305 family protein [Clostridium tetanomorphum]|uniref:DUF6305 domain-containing protein n=1 Tax=Clostridium tetanomorphum TaxID=1553 RepID=A0A923E609_CLOTT|nr:DUF6305 family protein [Clostridium tetanomorphum]MBC2397095.1 hypothetical protein [Clostridium tetanomorphum]NRZ99061.1 hypothetical protein [Clostridium tetanomorphum]